MTNNESKGDRLAYVRGSDGVLRQYVRQDLYGAAMDDASTWMVACGIAVRERDEAMAMLAKLEADQPECAGPDVQAILTACSGSVWHQAGTAPVLSFRDMLFKKGPANEA